MGFLAPAIPWIIQGGAALGGALLGKKRQQQATKAATARSPEEQQALTGAQTAAGGLERTGQSLLGRGLPPLEQATSYWSRLLGGSRAQMAQATAGPRAAISEQYRGAERGLERSGLRGPQREVAAGELGRQRAGQIAGLTSGVQPAAAGQLSDIGLNLVGQGTPLLGASGSIFSNLLGQATQNRQFGVQVGREEGERTSASIGRLLFDILTGVSKIRRGGGSSFGETPGSSFGESDWMHH